MKNRFHASESPFLSIPFFQHRTVAIIVISVLFWTCAQSQEYSPEQRDSTFWFFKRKPLVTYSIAAYSAFVIYKEYKWWWEGNYHPFSFSQEGFFNDYSLGVDKIGHLYTSYLYFTSFIDLMKWGGFDDETAFWVSFGFTAFHAISIEIADGFSTYTFSPDDLVANFAGIGYGYLQTKVPFFRNINFKWSYFPSDNARFRTHWHITGDYDGHIYWLSFNVHDLLPEGARGYWPKFLSLAFGYGGKNISEGSTGPRARKFAVSLDYNLLALPSPNDTWDTLKRIVNRFRLPAPGLRKVQGESAQFKALLLN